jgi:phosphohistidine phosphatase
MDLYLVRHAIAFDRDPVTWAVDAERPLTPDGVTKFRQAARGLRTLVPKVDVVLSSPWRRAWDTALLLQSEAKWPAPQSCDALTGSDIAALLAAIAAHDEARSVALVGHEPHLSAFGTSLLFPLAEAAVIEMKKGGVAYIETAGPAAGSSAILRWLLPPRILRRLA